jgi:hypothetical protein
MLRRLAASLVLIGAVALIYREAVSAYFFEDDFQWLVTRWSFRPSDLLDLASRSHFYRPVIELYFWIGSAVTASPAAFHVSSIALHALNGGLLYAVATAIGMPRTYAWVAALLFVVQPAYVDAVAWVGAIAEAIGACFGFSAILAILAYRRTGRAVWQALAALAFAVALLTHESSVVFLPLIVLADWTAGRSSWRWQDAARTYVPLVTIAAAYLVVDLMVNSRHYLITEGQYRIGAHMIRNVFEYIASLYVGERTLAAHAGVAIVIAAVLLRGTPRARYAVVWTIVAMGPFLPFTFANVSRYAYLPAAGLALLLAEGLATLDEWMSRRGVSWRHAVVATLVTALAIRFGVFASKGVSDFADRAESYRSFLVDLKQARPTMADGDVVSVDAATEARLPQRFLEAAVQWEYRNPTLRVAVSGR